jgi:hypothetical protein
MQMLIRQLLEMVLDHPHWVLEKIAIPSSRRFLAFARLQRCPGGVTAKSRDLHFPPFPEESRVNGIVSGGAHHNHHGPPALARRHHSQSRKKERSRRGRRGGAESGRDPAAAAHRHPPPAGISATGADEGVVHLAGRRSP